MHAIEGFPDFNNINPDGLRRRFNSEAWNDEDLVFEAKFMRVKWDSSYKDVVDWTSESMRDDYFARDFGADQIVISNTDNEGPQWNHKELMRWSPNDGKYAGTMRVPMPTESVNLFNYVAITYKYPQPVPGPEFREEKYFFFVDSVNALSPNATEVYLSMDVWTTYKFLVGINGISLTQGHWPVAELSATDYLVNPVGATVDLTADEPDLPRVKARTNTTGLISLQSEDPRVCIATTADFHKVEDAWEPAESADPSYRWWEDDSDLGWQGHTPVPPAGATTTNGANPGLRVYSVSPSQYNTLIGLLRISYPQLIKTIKAVYVLPANLISEGTPIDLLGIPTKFVRPQTSPSKIAEIGINKTLFGYETENSEYAKLYTDQFAEIIISDNQGARATVSLASLAGDLEVYARANSTFPFLKLQAFIDGIGGSGSKNYVVAPWHSSTATIYNSQFQDFTFDLEVPVYGVYLDPREDAGLENSVNEWLAKQQRDKAYDEATRNLENAFDISERDRVVTYETTRDSIINNFTNKSSSITTAFQNAIRSIDLSHTNADDSITTSFQNAIRSIDLNHTNTADSITASYQNTNRSINTAHSNADDSITAAYQNLTAAITANSDNAVAAANMARDNSLDGNELNYDNAETVRANQFLTDTNQMGVSKNIAELNMAGAALVQSYTLYQMDVDKKLGISSQAVQLATSSVNSSIGTIASSMGGASPLAAANGLVQMGISTFGAYRQLDIAAATYNHAYYNTDFMFWVNNAPFSNDHSMWVYPGEAPYEVTWPAPDAIADYLLNGNPLLDLDSNGGAQITSVARAVTDARYAADLEIAGRNYSNSFMINSRVKSVSDAIAARTRTVTVANNTRSVNMEEANALRTRNTDRDNNNRTQTQDGLSAVNSRDTDRDINDRTQTRNTTSATATRDTDRDNNDRTQTQNTTSATATRDTDRDINTASDGVGGVNRVNNNSIYGATGTVNANNVDNRALARLNRTANRDLAIEERDAARALSYMNSPNNYGEFGGPGEIDTWGLRGLMVTVNTVSKSAEALIGQYFKLKGYSMNSAFVSNPTLSVMEEWSYWKADDVWLSAGAINDANEIIFKNMFLDGVTVWRDPVNVKNVNLTNGVSV